MISIDPGVEAGFAIWQSHLARPQPSDWFLLKAEPLVPPKALPWEQRCDIILETLSDLCTHNGSRVLQIVCEWPFYHDTLGGREVAASGALVKLSIVVGMINELGRQLKIPRTFIEVRKWKGQMSKDATIHRIKKRLPLEQHSSIKSHAWDAVGIGLHFLGRF